MSFVLAVGEEVLPGVQRSSGSRERVALEAVVAVKLTYTDRHALLQVIDSLLASTRIRAALNNASEG